MSVLAFLTVVGALTLALSWAVAGVLYPLWGRLVAERVGLARGTLVVAALPALLAAGVVAASVLPAWFDTLFICHSGPGWLHLCWCHPDNAAGALPFAAGALLLLVPGRVRALWSVGREPLGSGSAPLVTELQRPIALLVGWTIIILQYSELSQRFATPLEDKFDGIAWRPGLGQAPVLEGCLAHFECRNSRCHDGGDHLLFLGGVEAYAEREGEPLLFVGGRYGVATDHPAQMAS